MSTVCFSPPAINLINVADRVSGTEFNDQVDFGSGLVIHGQSIGAAIESNGFDDSDGILGYVLYPWIRSRY